MTLFSPGVFEIRDQVLEEDMESTEDRLLLASQVAMLQKCLIELLNWLEVNLPARIMLRKQFDRFAQKLDKAATAVDDSDRMRKVA